MEKSVAFFREIYKEKFKRNIESYTLNPKCQKYGDFQFHLLSKLPCNIKLNLFACQ